MSQGGFEPRTFSLVTLQLRRYTIRAVHPCTQIYSFYGYLFSIPVTLASFWRFLFHFGYFFSTLDITLSWPKQSLKIEKYWWNYFIQNGASCFMNAKIEILIWKIWRLNVSYIMFSTLIMIERWSRLNVQANWSSFNVKPQITH